MSGRGRSTSRGRHRSSASSAPGTPVQLQRSARSRSPMPWCDPSAPTISSPKLAREFHFCLGWNRNVFIPEVACTRCKEKAPAEFHRNGRMLRKQEGYNYFARPDLVREGRSMLKSDTAIRRAATRNFIEHTVYLIDLTRPQRGGVLTDKQERTMRQICNIEDWNKYGFELLSDATRYGLVSLDTGELTWLQYATI
jgi:hypothetical protein